MKSNGWWDALIVLWWYEAGLKEDLSSYDERVHVMKFTYLQKHRIFEAETVSDQSENALFTLRWAFYDEIYKIPFGRKSGFIHLYTQKPET